MTELLIIADDLTGAIDTGVQLSKHYVHTRVIPAPEIDYKHLFNQDKTTVLVVNTESRHLSPEQAAYRIRTVMTFAIEAGIKRFYKKTDSTLRGNIGAELGELKKSLTQKHLGFIPAHPKLKRYTINGHHFVDQIPLHKTPFANDPLEPITKNNIADILSDQLKSDIDIIDIKKKRPKPHSEILIFDCTKTEDLDHILDFLVDHDCVNAMAGSAAIVELLPELYRLPSIKMTSPKIAGPALIINGSVNEISKQQVRFASGQGFNTFQIPQEWLANSISLNIPLVSKLIDQIHKAYLNNEHYLLTTTSFNDQNSFDQQNESPSNPENIATNVGIIARFIMEHIPYKTIVVFGGDTLMGIIKSLNCNYIEPESEILPGVAISLTVWEEKQLQLITKPGGYGDENVIFQISKHFKSSSQ